ncbi:MAG: hypothetical protein OXC62_17875 [Aestuariivita sp.]|nr:hypothetical protein [Aestuariivita sp.]
MKFVFILALFLVPSFSWASTCPEVPDYDAELEALIEEVRVAKNADQAQKISNQMWELWTDAPDEVAQALLDRGMTAISSSNFFEAKQTFDLLVEYCPDYAEGYNQRAYVNFLSQNYSQALLDLNLALERAPRHIGALSGKSLSLLALNRIDEARIALQEALELNPWLSERRLMDPSGPLAPMGEDI